MSQAAVVAVFAPLYPPAFRGGGPIRSIEALVSTAPRGVFPLVLTSDRDLGAVEQLPVVTNRWTQLGLGEVYYATVKSPWSLWNSYRSVRRRRPTLLHLNSFFHPVMTFLPLLLSRVGFWGATRILISPRGEFGGGAFRRRTFKKRIYINLFRLLGLHRMVLWHSTASHETADIRRIWGPGALILERENETLLGDVVRPTVRTDGSLRAVFLGRLVEHKGLAIALEALAQVTAPVTFDVYGSREDEDYVARCQSIAGTLPGHIQVDFHEPISPSNVVQMLSDYDLLLMPTAGENFGHVIAEALSASCFVMTTPETPWTEWFSAYGGGLVVARTAAAWTKTIDVLAGEDQSARLRRRLSAGATFEAWRARPSSPHIWSLALEATRGTESTS